jgi:uncharacterized protein involved in exopolysaccharide biosynthesis
MTATARDSGTEEALAVLSSREFLEAFIKDHDLLPRLFPRRWDSERHVWRGSQQHWPTPAKGVRYLTERVLTVTKDKKTGLIVLTVDWRDPNDASAFANDLVARVNSEMRARATALATAYQSYLEKELESTQLVGTRDAINRLIEAQIKQRMIAAVTPEYAFRVVGRALPPDADDFVSPRRLLLVAAGVVGGLLFACISVIAHASWKGRLPRQQPGR